MTAKFSEFLRTFQHHQSLSLICVDEVRLKVKFTSHLIASCPTCCVIVTLPSTVKQISKFIYDISELPTQLRFSLAKIEIP